MLEPGPARGSGSGISGNLPVKGLTSQLFPLFLISKKEPQTDVSIFQFLVTFVGTRNKVVGPRVPSGWSHLPLGQP